MLAINIFRPEFFLFLASTCTGYTLLRMWMACLEHYYYTVYIIPTSASICLDLNFNLNKSVTGITGVGVSNYIVNVSKLFVILFQLHLQAQDLDQLNIEEVGSKPYEQKLTL